MLKKTSLLVAMLLLSVMLAACGGDDEDPTATVAPPAATATPAAPGDSDDDAAEDEPEPTETIAEVEPTPTVEPATPTIEPTEEPVSEPTAEPTEEPATPTVESVPTEEPTVDTAEPTEPLDTGGDPAVEAALLDMLLAEEDLPEPYALFEVGPTARSDAGMTFCNQPSFSNPEARVAGVEAEFDRDPVEGPFILQSLTVYDGDISAEAFEYVRGVISECDEWVDEDGLTYQLEIIDVPDYGDESFGMMMTFDVPPVGEASAYFTLARFDTVLMVMGYLGLTNIDVDEFNSVTETAVEKIEAAEFER